MEDSRTSDSDSRGEPAGDSTKPEVTAEHLVARRYIETACQNVLADFGEANGPRATAKECADWLEQMPSEYQRFWGTATLDDWWKDHGDVETLHLWHLELAAIVCMDLVMAMDFRKEQRQRLLWDDEDIPLKERPRIFLQQMFGQLCNYNRSMFTLAKDGVDLQVLALFRAHFELAQQTLLLTMDRSFFHDYIYWFELTDKQERYKHWKKAMSPSRVRERLEAIIRTTDLDPNSAASIAQRDNSTYGWLSEHHHGQPLALFVRTYGKDGFQLGGKADTATIEILRTISSFNFTFFALLEPALRDSQKWEMNPRDTFSAALVFKWHVLRSLYLEIQATDELGSD